tara:strand:- start:666 stop:1226 length:561 start_codon:yes stop_codon:yes gene_type:complete
MGVLAHGDERMHIEEGWLTSARRVPSAHCDERPGGEVSAIVIHAISLPAGHFGGPWIEALFCGHLDVKKHPDFSDLEGVRVSAHALIRRTGELVQFVDFGARAWHAGRSCFKGRTTWNDFAIGIELEGTDTAPFTGRQYAVLREVIDACREAYDISEDWIVGHSDIAPGRKTDPGPAFEWARVQRS